MAVDPVEYIDKGQQYFQRYTYADNNPYKYTDPSGENLVGGLVGAGLEVGFQMMSGEYNPEAVAVSFGLGLVGAGIVDKIADIATLSKTVKTVAEVATEAAVSAAKQGITEGEVSIEKVGADLVGAGIAKGVSKGVKGLTSKEKAYQEKLDKSRRLSNIANKGRKRKAQDHRAHNARSEVDNHGSDRANGFGAAAGGLGSKAAEAASAGNNDQE